MKYFTLGPVEMDPETLEIGREPLPYFRDASFSDINLDLIRKLKRFLKTADNTRLAMLTASGTAAMEAAVSQLFNPNDHLLVINGGGFGKRFVEICERHSIPHDALQLDPTQPLDAETLAPYRARRITGVLVNIHETSNGRLYPIDTLTDFSRSQNATLVVDAISSFMADPYNMDQAGIDVTIFSSHKSLGVSPGLAFVAINDRTYEQRLKGHRSKSLYLDLNNHIEQLERGQTPFTPAVGVIMQLHDKLSRIEAQGLDRFLSDINQKALHFRRGISRLALRLPAYPLSNALTPIILPKPNALSVYATLRNHHGLLVNPCSGDWSNTMLRVGHMGNLTEADNDRLLDALGEILLLKERQNA